MASTPNATAWRNDSSVFSGAWAALPRWPMTNRPSSEVSACGRGTSVPVTLLRKPRARRHQRRTVGLQQHSAENRSLELRENLLRAYYNLALLRHPEASGRAFGLQAHHPAIEIACRHGDPFFTLDRERDGRERGTARVDEKHLGRIPPRGGKRQ